MYLNKKFAFPYEYVNSRGDYKQTIVSLRIEDFFSKLKNKRPEVQETERTKEINNLFNKNLRIFSIKIEKKHNYI